MTVSPGVKRFARYSFFGSLATSFDLLLIWCFTEYAGVPYYVATAVSFLIATSVNYAVTRRYVFKGTKRSVEHGYLYYIGISIGGAAVTTLSVIGLVSAIGLHYLVARIMVAGVIGLANYLLNLYFNFKVVGRHP